MSLQPGIYLIKNVKTEFYMLPNNFTSDGSDQQVSTTLNVGAREDPLFDVSVDQDGLYALRSAAGLYIAASGKTLRWQDVSYQWSITAAQGGSWNIKPHDAPDFSVDHAANLVLTENGTASDWEFILRFQTVNHLYPLLNPHA